MSSSQEVFQPIAVAPPSHNPLLFKLRCLIDLQLGTITHYLKPAIKDFPGGKIIDIGAGESPWREWLPSHCRYYGLDVKHASEFGMKQEGRDIIYYEGKKMPFDE